MDRHAIAPSWSSSTSHAWVAAVARMRRARRPRALPGPRTGADLDRSYAGADVLVLASRAETYGMAVTEELARGLPSAQRPSCDPRPRLRNGGDGPLARATASGAAALGRARPGRGPAEARRGRSPRSGSARYRCDRRAQALRHHAPAAERHRRCEPDHRVRPARPA